MVMTLSVGILHSNGLQKIHTSKGPATSKRPPLDQRLEFQLLVEVEVGFGSS
jgi:hypothetical protein